MLVEETSLENTKWSFENSHPNWFGRTKKLVAHTVSKNNEVNVDHLLPLKLFEISILFEKFSYDTDCGIN